MARPKAKNPMSDDKSDGANPVETFPEPIQPKSQRVVEEDPSLKNVRHVEASDFLTRVNQTVSLVHSLFQDRDSLLREIELFKAQLGIAKEIALERQLVVSMQREKEAFLYQWEREKLHKQQELDESQKSSEASLKKREDEQRLKIARENEEHAAQLKRAEEDQNRRLKVEREDFERLKNQFAEERAALKREQEAFKKEREDVQKRLLTELNVENKHAREVMELNHQRELAVLRGELELERSAKGKQEASLKEAYVQVERLNAQMSQLSRDALTSASSSAMVNRLEEMVTQITGNPRKTKENN